jgi:uncharacterized protein YjbI with pentapeptide repeats
MAHPPVYLGSEGNMADESHLAKLHEGVDAWNSWRDEHPEIIPDFASSDLQEANLSIFKLYNVDLCLAYLRNANLFNTNLRRRPFKCGSDWC